MEHKKATICYTQSRERTLLAPANFLIINFLHRRLMHWDHSILRVDVINEDCPFFALLEWRALIHKRREIFGPYK